MAFLLRFIFSNLLFIYLSISSCAGTTILCGAEESFFDDDDEGEDFLGDEECFLGDEESLLCKEDDSMIRFFVKVLKGID